MNDGNHHTTNIHYNPNLPLSILTSTIYIHTIYTPIYALNHYFNLFKTQQHLQHYAFVCCFIWSLLYIYIQYILPYTLHLLLSRFQQLNNSCNNTHLCLISCCCSSFMCVFTQYHVGYYYTSVIALQRNAH